MTTLEQTVRSTLDTNMSEFNYGAMERLIEDVTVNKVKRKVTKQVMLDSLFDRDTGESHEHSTELMELIGNEYQVDMVEVSSGNGSSQNIWNYAKDGYDVYLSADGRETSEHNRNGLSDSLVDTYEGIQDKNLTDIPAYQVVTDNDGNDLRLDDMANMVTVSDSNYSIWDTIEEKGMLIIRHLSNWYGKGCQFKKEGYVKRQALRLTKKHNRLMGYTVTTNKDDGNNGTVKKLKIRQLTTDMRGNKHLTRLVKNARHGKQWARDELSKIGYNEFSIN